MTTKFVAIHLHFGTAVLTEKNPVADLEIDRSNSPFFKILPLPTATTFPKWVSPVASIRDHDAACGLTLFFFSFPR